MREYVIDGYNDHILRKGKTPLFSCANASNKAPEASSQRYGNGQTRPEPPNPLPFRWSAKLKIRAALSVSFWTTYAVIVGHFSIASGRFTVAGIVFILWILIKQRRLSKAEFSLYLNLIIIGFTGVFAFNSILYIGIRHTTVVNATIINSFNPIATMILAMLILKEKVSSPQYAAALSIIGVFFIMSSGYINMIDKFKYGDIIILVNTFIWALFSVFGKKVMQVLSPLDTIDKISYLKAQ